MSHEAIRRALIATARRTEAARLTHGTSGNLSVRLPHGFLVTPTGMSYEVIEPGDLVVLGLDGRAAPGQRRPSTEWRMHRDVYASRPEVAAVVHAHPPFCSTFACLRRDLPPIHYMIAVAGPGPVRCAEYATFGTPELSRHVLTALEGRTACLLANHGLVAVGPDLDTAFRTALEVERVAEVYWRALAVGRPAVLRKAEMERVAQRFRTYGQQEADGATEA